MCLSCTSPNLWPLPINVIIGGQSEESTCTAPNLHRKLGECFPISWSCPRKDMIYTATKQWPGETRRQSTCKIQELFVTNIGVSTVWSIGSGGSDARLVGQRLITPNSQNSPHTTVFHQSGVTIVVGRDSNSASCHVQKVAQSSGS